MVGLEVRVSAAGHCLYQRAIRINQHRRRSKRPAT
jgi:hypothetical protein